MKKAYFKLALQSHPDKNKHPQASDMMRMINQVKELLEDLLRYNDTVREEDENLKRQEEYWIEDKIISKSQEESEEQKKI